MGSGISIHESIHKVRHPTEIRSPEWNYAFLILSLVFEGAAWTIAYREFNKSRSHANFITAVRDSNDPTIFTVLFEDAAAMLGFVIAFAGVAGSPYFNISLLDGAAAMGIGIVLAIVAVLLAIDSKGFFDRRRCRSGGR